MKNKLPTIVITLAFIAGGTVLIWILGSQYLKNQAVDNCLKAATVEEQMSEWVVAKRPIPDVYQECMSSKGY